MRACSDGKSSSQRGSSCSSASRTSASLIVSTFDRAFPQVRTMISGARRMPRNWSTTIRSTSPAEIRLTGAGLHAPFEYVHGDVVSVELPVAACVARSHDGTARTEDQALEQRWGASTAVGGALARALLQDVLNAIPKRSIDDRLVLAGIRGALVHRLADIHRVCNDPVEITLLDRLATLRCDALGCKGGEQLGDGTEPGEPLEHEADLRCFLCVDDQLAVLDVVAKRRPAAHPHAFLS